MTHLIKKGWKGEYPLWRAFWIHTVLLNAVLLLLSSFLLSLFLTDKTTAVRLIMNYNIISVFIGIWQTVGVWRSARAFIKEKKGLILAYCAQLITLVYLFRISLSLFLLLFYQQESITALESQLDELLQLKLLAEQTP